MHVPAFLERKLRARTLLGKAEWESLAAAFGRPRTLARKAEISLNDGETTRAYLLVDGWVYTYKVLPNGARQVIEIAIPGDIVGLNWLHLRNSDILATAASAAVVCDLTLSAFEKLLSTTPAAAAALLWIGSRDESVIVEHLVDIGRRTAPQRVAHLMLELNERLRLVGLSQGGAFRCPLNQSQVADALGLTAIHLNRTLRELRTDGLMMFRDGVVQLTDPARLASLCGYDGGYLDHLTLEPLA